MRLTLLANLAAFALFTVLTACMGLCRWELLLFQLVLQMLTNEFWGDLFMLPFKGLHLYGVGQEKLADPARMRRVARWSCGFVLFFPALLLAALAGIDHWGEGALWQALHLPPGGALVVPVLAAQGLLFVASLVGGLVPLSYRMVIEALMARRERRMVKAGLIRENGEAFVPPPTHAGVESLPHGLPPGVQLPACLAEPQRCSPLHARHVEEVREQLLAGERAVLSTSPAGVVPLPSGSNERLFGALGLCLAAILLYTAMGLFEELNSHIITSWVVVVLGLLLLPASLRLLRGAARRQAQLRRTDYVITNYRLHICRAGHWEAVSLAPMEVLVDASYGEGRGDVQLCPESGPETYKLINVEHADELASLLEGLISAARR